MITKTLTIHPKAPTATQPILDELYGRYMAAVNMNGGEGLGETSPAATWAWAMYTMARDTPQNFIMWAAAQAVEATR